MNIKMLNEKEAIASETCPICKKISEIKINDADRLIRWHKGEGHIQDMLSDLSVCDRETLMTGICANCQKEMFGED